VADREDGGQGTRMSESRQRKPGITSSPSSGAVLKEIEEKK